MQPNLSNLTLVQLFDKELNIKLTQEYNDTKDNLIKEAGSLVKSCQKSPECEKNNYCSAFLNFQNETLDLLEKASDALKEEVEDNYNENNQNELNAEFTEEVEYNNNRNNQNDESDASKKLKKMPIEVMS